MSNSESRGRFVWHELLTTDTAAAGEFYTGVVPWRTEDSGMPGYTLFMSGKYRAAGLMALPDDSPGTPPHWLIYIGTPDVDATAAQAQKLGGKVLKAPGDIPNVGRFAVLADPQGATFAVFTPGGTPGDGVPSGTEVGDFTWHELATTDIDAALDFYIELFGWARGEAHNMGDMGIYQILSHGGKDVGGLWKVRDNSTPPNWMSYVRVSDVEKATELLKEEGGRVMHGPVDVPGGSRITVGFDPQGGAFAVVRAPEDAHGASADAPAAKKASRTKAPAKPAADTQESATGKVLAAVKKAAGQVAETGKRAVGKVAATVASVRKGSGSTATKAPAKKTAAKKPTPQPAPKKAPAKKAPARKVPAKKAPARTTAAKRGKSAAKGKSAQKRAPAKTRAGKAAARKSVTKGSKAKGKAARKK